MRILHTADWHLGKLFYGDYLTEEQAYVLEGQFLSLVKEEKIDAVVLSGDVYDRSLPPAEAVELFDEIATKITAELHLPFFVISGNHDSAARLSFASSLLEKEGLYITGPLDRLKGPLVLEDAFGPVAFVPVPFAEPALVRHYAQDAAIHTHEQALAQLLALQVASIPPKMRTVCIAHAFVAGGISSDSERPLSIGGSDQVDSSLFFPFTYTALGHLHGPQQVTRPNIRYAGSLLKYSFGEAKQKKGAVIVDMDGTGQTDISFVPFTPRRDVRIITGMFDELMSRADAAPDDFILARVEDTQPILDGMNKLRQKYPHVLALETPNRHTQAAADRNFNVQQMTAQELFADFSQAMRPDQSLTAGEKDCLHSLWQELLQEEGGDK